MVELEYDSETNSSYGFRPAMREVRGRFDVNRLPEAGSLRKRFPTPIPGQRLGLDANGVYVREPLYQEEFKTLRAEIEKTAKLEPERTYLDVDVATFCYWVKEAMKSGHLKIVAGALPEKVQGEPKTVFHYTPQPSPMDRLASEFRRLGDLLEKVLAKK